MTNTATLPAPVDSLAHRPNAQSYKLERTYRFPTDSGVEVIRVQVNRDSVEMQSWGNASVLGVDRVWTTLVVAEREVVNATRSPYNAATGSAGGIITNLGPIADELVRRARAVLGL